jgi:drug/metabolite transporter (DMT)-like permease
VWFDWGTRLLAILALLTIVVGLLILSLPETMEGQEIISLNKTHSLRVADLLGAALVGLGAVVAWATVLAWQRKRIQQ